MSALLMPAALLKLGQSPDRDPRSTPYRGGPLGSHGCPQCCRRENSPPASYLLVRAKAIADLWDLDARVIHLVDDAETESEPISDSPSAHPTMSLALLVQVGAVPGPPRSVCDHRLSAGASVNGFLDSSCDVASQLSLQLSASLVVNICPCQ